MLFLSQSSHANMSIVLSRAPFSAASAAQPPKVDNRVVEHTAASCAWPCNSSLDPWMRALHRVARARRKAMPWPFRLSSSLMFLFAWVPGLSGYGDSRKWCVAKDKHGVRGDPWCVHIRNV
eukprot:2070029-Amphidinium_carterae.1